MIILSEMKFWKQHEQLFIANLYNLLHTSSFIGMLIGKEKETFKRLDIILI